MSDSDLLGGEAEARWSGSRRCGGANSGNTSTFVVAQLGGPEEDQRRRQPRRPGSGTSGSMRRSSASGREVSSSSTPCARADELGRADRDDRRAGRRTALDRIARLPTIAVDADRRLADDAAARAHVRERARRRRRRARPRTGSPCVGPAVAADCARRGLDAEPLAGVGATASPWLDALDRLDLGRLSSRAAALSEGRADSAQPRRARRPAEHGLPITPTRLLRCMSSRLLGSSSLGLGRTGRCGRPSASRPACSRSRSGRAEAQVQRGQHEQVQRRAR